MTKHVAYYFFNISLMLSPSLHAACASFVSEGARFNLMPSPGIIEVTKNGNKLLEIESANIADGSVFITDFNFDKKPDFAVLRDSGIERYFDVYVFDAKTGTYQLNKAISELACPTVNTKKRLVLSTCNHASACDKWQDSFTVSAAGLELVRRDGTTCDPASGREFKYFEVYSNNKIIHKKTSPTNDRRNK